MQASDKTFKGRQQTNAIISSLLVVAMIFGSTKAAFASEVTVKNSSISTQQISEDQLAEIESDIKVLFTKYVVNVDGKYEVNASNVLEDGYAEYMPSFQVLAENLNGSTENLNVLKGADLNASNRTQGGIEFAKCLALGGLGISSTALTAAAWAEIGTAVAAYNWGLAASTISRILAPLVAKGTIRALGGPAAIAVALGWAVFGCKDEL